MQPALQQVLIKELLAETDEMCEYGIYVLGNCLIAIMICGELCTFASVYRSYKSSRGRHPGLIGVVSAGS